MKHPHFIKDLKDLEEVEARFSIDMQVLTDLKTTLGSANVSFPDRQRTFNSRETSRTPQEIPL